MLTIIPNVLARRAIAVKQLGWLEGRRAETRPNFPANRDYVDLRGFTLADLDAVMDEERIGYAILEAGHYASHAIETVDRQQRASKLAPMLDFGIASTVVALSALGCVPVTSCRGGSLGAHAHLYPAPMTTFYARKAHTPALLAAVEEADINIVNAGAKLEVYSEDLRKVHAFAAALRSVMVAGESPLPSS
jgi:hypothetical protein